MRHFLLAFFVIFNSSFSILANADITPKAEVATPYVTMETNFGDIVIELNPEKAPITVANFLSYIKDDFYKDTIFHRVIKDFMIQGGGFTETMTKKATKDQIKNEAKNGLFNNTGTIAMARTRVVDSASSQFFINLKNNYFLNHGSQDYGYAVFGQVVSGMKIINTIGMTQTTSKQGMRDVPLNAVIIKGMTVSYQEPKL